MKKSLTEFEYFLEQCFISNLDEVFQFIEKKLNDYFLKHPSKFNLEKLLDNSLYDFLIEVENDIVSIVAKKGHDKLIISSTEIKNTPSEFYDVIINYEMFIVGLIQLYRMIKNFYSFFDEEEKIESERIVEIYEMLYLLLSTTEFTVTSFFDFSIKYVYIKNDCVMIDNVTLKECKNKDCSLYVHLLTEVVLLQSIKKIVVYIFKNYRYFLDEKEIITFEYVSKK